MKFDIMLTYILGFTLFGVFISKGLFNIFSVLFILLTIYSSIKNRKIGNRRILKLSIFLIGFGIITSFITEGFGGALSFIEEERLLFYYLAFSLSSFSLEVYEKAEKGFFVGGLASAIFSPFALKNPHLAKKIYPGVQILPRRMGSFQNNIRWGQLLVLLIGNRIKGLFSRNKGEISLSIILLSLYTYNLSINGGRGGILASFIIILVFILLIFTTKTLELSKKWIAISLIPLLIGIIGISRSDYFKSRIKSIFNVTNNTSNVTRLHFIKIGTDIILEKPFFGHGVGRGSEVFYEYIENQDEGYRERYYYPFVKRSSGTPFENNYINMAVEYGIIYTLVFNLLILFILANLLKKAFRISRIEDRIRLFSIISVVLGIKIYEFFFPGTDNYVYFIGIYYMFYGLSISRGKDILTNKKKVEGKNEEDISNTT